MADHVFQDWHEAFCPFDAIGFAAITSTPPSQGDFDKAVRYARFVTDPDRIARAGDVALGLPYSREQVDQAVAYFTCQQPTVNSQGRAFCSSEILDAVAWEWAFEELIGFQKQHLYFRSWAPHRLRWEHIVLDEPVKIDVSPKTTMTTETTASRPATAQGPTSRFLSSTAAIFEPATPARLARLRQSLPPQQTSQVSPELGSFVRTKQTSNFNSTRIRDRASLSHLLLSSSPPAPHASSTRLDTHTSDANDDDDDETTSDPGSKIQFHKTQRQQHKRVFIGFHRAQVKRLSASQQTRQLDYRQAAYAYVDSLGRVQRLLDRRNVVGETIPEEHRLVRRGSSAVIASGDVLYLDELAALGSYAEVNKRVLEMIHGGGDGEEEAEEDVLMPTWVPTPSNRASLMQSRDHGAKRARST